MSTDTLNIVLSIALGVMLLVMAVLMFVFRRARPGSEQPAAAYVPPVPAVHAPPMAAAPAAVAPPEPEPIPSMAERMPDRGYERYFAPPQEPARQPDPGPSAAPAPLPGSAPAAAPLAAAMPEFEAVPDEGILYVLTDPATGLDNRWAWDRMVHEENLRKRRYGRPVSVVVAELHGIENLAQRVGREPTDRLILAIGEALRRYSRSCDRIARVDNARFYVLLPETDDAHVVHFVERVRRACDLWLEAGAVALHLSMGWATAGPDEPIEAAMVTARERLITELRRGTRRAG